MTAPLEDQPPEQQAQIRALAENAPPLTDRQRERLQLLFRGGGAQAEQAGETP